MTNASSADIHRAILDLLPEDGSTIGNGRLRDLTAARLGLITVDVGIPMLSMHSARELCGTLDPLWLAQALGAYWAGA